MWMAQRFTTVGRLTKLNKILLSGGAGMALVGAVLSVGGCGPTTNAQGQDPVVRDYPVAFVKRPLIFDDSQDLIGDDVRRPERFSPGAVLYLKERASPSATAVDISSEAFDDPMYLNEEGKLLYDVKDLAVSPDGKKLVFAMRAPEIEGADVQPTWNIWEYDLEGAGLRRVIESDTVAEQGQDIAPHYLADGGIVFASTRQRGSRAILLDEGKPQFAALDEDMQTRTFVLHRMDADGSNIRQISFNQSHDLDPYLLDNGKVVFSRWDNAGSLNEMNLYQINPDGTGLSVLYGRHSHDQGSDGGIVQFLKPMEISEGDVLVQLRDFTSDQFDFAPVRVHINTHTDANVSFTGSESAGHTPEIPNVRTDGEPNVAGQYGAVFPLNDGTGRLLVSWSPCRLIALDEIDLPVEDIDLILCDEETVADPNLIRADPVYGLWIYDPVKNTQRPIDLPKDGFRFDEAVLMTSRPLANYIRDFTPEGEAAILAEEGFGLVNIRSVYDQDGVDTTPAGITAMADPRSTAVDERPARFMRIEKAVSIPPPGVRRVRDESFGVSSEQRMREIIGYVPIEPDGSVRFAVPANVAFAVSIVDGEGRRTSERHQNWLQVAPGETLACNGCHTSTSSVPHGRPDAEPSSINSGAESSQAFPGSDPDLVAEMGETMAETWSRLNGTRRLQPDLVFDDEWTDGAVATPGTGINLAYAYLRTDPPIGGPCATEWSSICRAVINYETHIHPLWSVDRRVYDDNDVEIPEANQPCTACHSNRDGNNAIQVPVAQLNLADGYSADVSQQYRSYRELLVDDNEQELVNGALVDRLIDTGLTEDDGNGNQVPVYATVPVYSTMDAAGALASEEFMAIFAAGGVHAGYLSAAELKLISEWLDLGAQYFNNPFDVPQN